MNMNPYVETIAIDGPAGSGKSTVGAKVAEQLHYLFVDTGLLYRAITAQTLSRGLDVHDAQSIHDVAAQLKVDIDTVPQGQRQLHIHGEAVGEQLYTPVISHTVPTIAAYGVVRSEVRRIQAEIARYGQIIFAGRDIGTVVLPHAELKIFLDASIETRASRRFLDGETRDAHVRQQILEEMRVRDTHDRTRAESPLRPADDAVMIYTDHMSIDEVVERVLDHALKK